ncbi:MAG: hypothetical protein IJ256_09775 [Bacteroidaceae bacterium]|nr:hypothetical protein [Bacteroidaceae bacterium]
MELINRLREFIEAEMRSCSMDFGCITPEYVYRMWGGTVPLNEIETALRVHGSWTNQATESSAEFMVNG